MSDVAGGGAAAAIADAGAGAGAGGEPGAGGGEAGGGAAAPEWLASLPDDLKADATLARYADIPALARGLIETKKAVGAPKLPGADTAIDNFEAFHAARPAEATAYDITVPEGYDPQFGEGFRTLAHEIGLHPSQAKKIVDFNNAAIAQQVEAAQTAAKQEVDSFKAELTAKGGDFDAQINAVAALLEKHGLGDPDATMKALEGLETQIGATQTLKLLFGLAQGFGEPALPPQGGGEQGGAPRNLDSMTIEQVRAARHEKMANSDWLAKANTPGTPENREYNQLIQAEARAVDRARRG